MQGCQAQSSSNRNVKGSTKSMWFTDNHEEGIVDQS